MGTRSGCAVVELEVKPRSSLSPLYRLERFPAFHVWDDFKFLNVKYIVVCLDAKILIPRNVLFSL